MAAALAVKLDQAFPRKDVANFYAGAYHNQQLIFLKVRKMLLLAVLLAVVLLVLVPLVPLVLVLSLLLLIAPSS